jgi:arginine deiminase
MHLDTVLTMVDHDAFLASGGHLARCGAFRLTPGRRGGSPRVAAVDDLCAELAHALSLPAVRMITTGGDEFARCREQWSDGANVLAVAPGTVIAYDRNSHANDSLSHAGIDVLTIPSAELSRGRGGPHCLSAPLWRAA